MSRNVRGVLFVDYVRMLRSLKDVDWSKHLSDDDRALLAARVDPNGWYPMEAFERMGLAILAEVTAGALEPVRLWGSASIDGLCVAYPTLLAPGRPDETLARFHGLRRSFFDYDALTLTPGEPGHSTCCVAYQMSARAEEAATWQTMGFFDRLLALAGAQGARVELKSASWRDGGATEIALAWTPRK